MFYVKFLVWDDFDVDEYVFNWFETTTKINLVVWQSIIGAYNLT